MASLVEMVAFQGEAAAALVPASHRLQHLEVLAAMAEPEGFAFGP
jgi:hypothetical protein